MASLKLKFRPSTTQGKEGTLYFQLVHNRNSKTVATGYHVNAGEWDSRSSSIRVAGRPEREAQLRLLASRLEWDAKRIAAIITRKEMSRLEYSTDDIVSEYRRLPPCETWFAFIRGMIAKKTRLGRLGTARTYRNALASFARFRNDEDLTIDALDADIVSTYEEWLKGRGLTPNSSSCYLRTLRTLYRKAVEMGLADDRNIFRHVFTGFAKTRKRAIPLEAVKKIRLLRLEAGSPLAFARDMFMLSVYLQGMSFIDIAYLKKSDIRNGLLLYRRKKTRQSLAISWEPAMQDIVDEYARRAGDGPYLLPIITKPGKAERRQYENMEHNINRNLKKIGEMAGLHVPLTTYVARHTWASAIRDMGCDISIVSTGLGHESLKTTQVYLSLIDNATVAKANRRMIDKITR